MSNSSTSPSGGGGRGWVIVLAAIVLAAIAYVVLKRPAPPAAPAPAPVAAEEPAPEKAVDAPKIPFADVTVENGIKFVQRGGATGEKMLPESGGSGVALFDYDQDGDADLLLISGRPWPWNEKPADAPPSTLALYRNDAGKFSDVTADAGLVVDFYGQGAAVGDYDGDGDDDLFLTAVGQNKLFRNDQGKFTDVTAETGVAGNENDWTTSAGFFDYDRDGDLDLFVCNYLRWTRERDQAADRRVPGTGLTYAHPSNFDGVQNFLYRNDGGKFVDVAKDSGIHVNELATGKPLGKALAVTFVDFDNDGWLDVFVANDTVRHFLYRNLGNGKFEEIGGGRGFALNALGVTTSGMGVDFGWIHNDDRLAVAVSNFAGEMTALYLSQPGGEVFFTDEAVAAGVSGPTRDRLSFGLLFDDMDLDGRTDMVQANGHLEQSINTVQPNQQYAQPAQLFWNAGEASPRVFVSLPGENVNDLSKPIVGRALASADFDGDGDLDLVFTQVDGPPLVARNDQKLGGHWLRCRLKGPAGNPHSIGATVELKAGGVTQRRVVMPTRSYLSQTEPVVTFGLGTATAVESLTVTWPDGMMQKVTPAGIDREITIEPNNESFSSLANTATARLENGNFEEAIAILKQALDLKPDSVAVRRNLARAYLLGGQPDAAVAELDKLPAKATADSPAIAYLLGLAAIRQAKYEDAIKQFRAAIAADSQVATLHFQLALALSALGERDEAQAELQKTAELDPLHGGAQYQLATYARKAGDQEAFRRYMRDYERIRKIKGPADALALEECRFTKPEIMTDIAAVQLPDKVPKLMASVWQSEAVEGAPKLAAAAVWSLEDSGRYQLVGLTYSGDLVIFEFDDAGKYREIARSSQPLAGDVAGAAVVVANALVDVPYQSNQTEQAGDYPEIAIVTPRQAWLARYTPGKGFDDLTETARLSEAKGDIARWADLDHDGDVDLVTGSATGLQAWRNNGDGSFVDATSEFGLTDAGAVADFAAVDLDGVNLGVDLALVGSEKSALERNQYGGKFAADADWAAKWPVAERVLADDFNNDGLPDFVFIASKQVTLILSGIGQQQSLAADLDSIDAATTIDVDNDGWLDVVVSGRVGESAKSFLWRNSGGQFAEQAESLPSQGAVGRGGLLDLDADNDGHTDLLQIAGGSQPVLLQNKTPGDNRQLKLSLRSYAGHPSSIGVRIQVRREDFAVIRFTQRELPIEIGMGPNAEADVIQTLWMNGVARNEIGVKLANAPLRITIIEFVRTSSCPFLYAWLDGSWQFVTDLLGTAPLNVSVARNVPMPPDSDEVVVLGPAERFADGAVAARVRITSELREATYLDEVRLLAVDHPANTRVFSRDRAAMTPVEGPQIVVGRDPFQLATAIGSDGVDRTAALAEEDSKFAEPGELLPQPVVGFTRPLAVEFEFGELPESDDLLLVMTGWFRFGDSSTNIAGSQRSDLQVIWPKLEVQTSDGNWQMVDEMVGLPAGNTKTIVYDLAEKLPVGATRFRLTTSFEVRWDQFALYRKVPSAGIRMTQLEPTSADLAWHGFAELRPTAFDRPQEPNLAHMRQTPPWFTALEGWCTRFGDVVPLLDAPDELMAILNSGDGATLEFPSATLPPREAMANRTLLLYTRGWIKEENPNSLADRNVAPFPGSDLGESEATSDWQLEYNTRWVPRNRFGQAPDNL